jgi:phage shock protein PspC (stress-responsive transcriptional regulator)
MKKTLSINIAGIVFHIEEDAFATLDAYLKSIHAYFKNFEGAKDIVDDIEARIAEKFWNIRETEKTEAITQAHVDALIASLGTVADFKEIEGEDGKQEQTQNSSTHTGEKKIFRRDLTNKQIGGVASGVANYFEIDPIWVRLILIVGFFGLFPLLHAANLVFWAYVACWIAIPGEITVETDKSYRKFYRDPENEVVGGVMAGISAYTGWDVGLLRVLAVISLFFFGTGAVAYIIIMAITPKAKTVTDKMAMTGEPITLENIEKNIKDTFQPDSTEEKPLTRVLLFPFRALATIFTSLKPILFGIKWFVQYLIGIVLIIISIALAFALIVVTTAGVSGFDHGLIGLNFGEIGIPIYLLAQDLPAWAIWAAYAAIVPMILGIGISGVSLLANRKLTNKTYSYISTTILIVGWIGLFSAFSFVGRNFQRTASVNYVKDIPTDSSYVFSLHRESQESVWEKMLGNTLEMDVFLEQFLDDEELHDFNRDGFSRAQITMAGYDGKTIQVIQFAKSNGRTRAEAEVNAKSIEYHFNQKGDQIILDSHFGLKQFKFRNQRMRVKILVPYGVSFGMTKEFALYIENVLDSGYFNENGTDLFVGSKWTFSADKGLVCLNREPNQSNDSSDSNDSETEEGTTSSNLSISKTVNPFTQVEISQTDGAKIEIKQASEYKISMESSDPVDNWSQIASVEGSLLRFKSLPSNVTVTIETPDLRKVDLGGTGRTEISGFDAAKMEVILHDFHSLKLEGRSDALAASTYDRSELDASGFKVKNATVWIDKKARMDLNVSESLRGEKYASATANNANSLGKKEIWTILK